MPRLPGGEGVVTLCLQLLDEIPDRGLVLRCALETGHKGHHKPRGWRSPKRRSKPAKPKRRTLTEAETRARLKTLMQGDE